MSNNDLTSGILFTDYYQIAMAQVYFCQGIHEKLVQFEHFYRKNPDYGTHKAGYCIYAGFETLLNWMDITRFRKVEVSYLKSLRNLDGKMLFEQDFLDYLYTYGNFERIKVTTIPEGRVIHPNLPLTVVEGPLIMAQLLETSLLNHLNYQTLIATKASLIKQLVGEGQTLLEFGLRRGQGSGANEGSRAALIGGADFTSNVGISEYFGIAPKGTHSHSMIQMTLALGGSELDAFKAFAETYPDACSLLVDTIDTLESGVPNAIKVFEELRRRGYKPLGIRLDSGDLAYLVIEASQMLDKAGFSDTKIVISNDLDEIAIQEILRQIVGLARKKGIDSYNLLKRLVYGVGTKLITSHGSPALGGVYKLTSVYDKQGWQPTLKISNTLAKTTLPGRKSVCRMYENGSAIADVIMCVGEDPYSAGFGEKIFDPLKHTHEYLGKANTWEPQTLNEMREARIRDLGLLPSAVKTFPYPQEYPVLLSTKLLELQKQLVDQFAVER